MKVNPVITGIVVLSLNLIVGCGDDNVAGPEGIPAELIATWTYRSVTVNGDPMDLGTVLEWHPGTSSARFRLDGSGSFLYEELDSSSVVVWTERGDFTVSGNTFTFTVTQNDDGPVDPPTVMSGIGSVFAYQLTFIVVFEGDTYIFISTK